MVNPINTLLASTGLFGQAGTGQTVGVGSDVLAAWASAKAGVGVDASQFGGDPNAPLAPVWQPGISPSAAALADRALNGKAFFDTTAKLYTDLGASGDYRKLFAVHTGLSTLQALVTRMGDTSLSAAQKKTMQTQFTRGMAELAAFFNKAEVRGRASCAGRSPRRGADDARDAQRPLKTTSPASCNAVRSPATLPGLDPNAKFNIVATAPGGARAQCRDRSLGDGLDPTFARQRGRLRQQQARRRGRVVAAGNGQPNAEDDATSSSAACPSSAVHRHEASTRSKSMCARASAWRSRRSTQSLRSTPSRKARSARG